MSFTMELSRTSNASSHVLPPCAGATVRVNVRLWAPPPQLAEQVVYSLQVPLQSIGQASVLHVTPDCTYLQCRPEAQHTAIAS